jgi:peptide/nickel transport system ATP-binding protein
VSDMLLQVDDLCTHFDTDFGTVKAVDGVTFDVRKGEVLGIVGESGCGKSVTARSILRILSRTASITSGSMLFRSDYGKDGEPVDLAALPNDSKTLRQIRGKEITMIFQEPMTAFCPVYTIGNQISEALEFHQKMKKPEARERVADLLDRVGIPNAAQHVDSYPYQLSGGMRQRAMIAMALSCNPKLLVADEPTTALDVTIQAQIMELIMDLHAEYGMSVIMITHDLGVVAEVSDRVAVMYLGKVVERGTTRQVFKDPLHPYTKALLKSIPKVSQPRGPLLPTIKGSVPDPYNVPEGCHFHPRCEAFMAGICDGRLPEIAEIRDGHEARCYLYEDVKTATFGEARHV